jgi:hypothetical protein
LDLPQLVSCPVAITSRSAEDLGGFAHRRGQQGLA